MKLNDGSKVNRKTMRSKAGQVELIKSLQDQLSQTTNRVFQVINSVNSVNRDMTFLTRLSPVDTAEKGDVVVIDYFARLINEDGSLGDTFQGGMGKGLMIKNLGSGELVPGFEENLFGKAVGSTLELDVTFPEQYTESLSNKKAKFFVAILESLRGSDASTFVDEVVGAYQKEKEEEKKNLEESKTKA